MQHTTKSLSMPISVFHLPKSKKAIYFQLIYAKDYKNNFYMQFGAFLYPGIHAEIHLLMYINAECTGFNKEMYLHITRIYQLS